MKYQVLLLATLSSLCTAGAWRPEARSPPTWLRNVLVHRSQIQSNHQQSRAHHQIHQFAKRHHLHKKVAHHDRGQKVSLRFLVNVIAKGLSKNDADAFAALSAIERIVQPSLMDSINQMRCEVCWKRTDILGHQKCLTFLKNMCKKWHNGGEKDGKVCPNVCTDLLDLCAQHHWDDASERQQFGRDLYKEITGEDPPPPPRGAEAEEEEAEPLAAAPSSHAPSAPATPPPIAAPGPTAAVPPAPAPAGAPGDRDGDATGDVGDAFPDDPSESRDSDGDGIGDGRDPWPLNPNCQHEGLPCEDDEVVETTIPMTQVVDPTTLNKVGQGLPSQGYDEHSQDLVRHKDKVSATDDWGGEWPQWNEESQADSIARICEKYPESDWCILQARKRQLRHAGAPAGAPWQSSSLAESSA